MPSVSLYVPYKNERYEKCSPKAVCVWEQRSSVGMGHDEQGIFL
jgi:hypothetical protein